jgi:hypothetical protein
MPQSWPESAQSTLKRGDVCLARPFTEKDDPDLLIVLDKAVNSFYVRLLFQNSRYPTHRKTMRIAFLYPWEKVGHMVPVPEWDDELTELKVIEEDRRNATS